MRLASVVRIVPGAGAVVSKVRLRESSYEQGLREEGSASPIRYSTYTSAKICACCCDEADFPLFVPETAFRSSCFYATKANERSRESNEANHRRGLTVVSLGETGVDTEGGFLAPNKLGNSKARQGEQSVTTNEISTEQTTRFM